MPNPAKRKSDRIDRLLISLLNQSGIKACKIGRYGHPGGDIYLEPAAGGGKGGMVAEIKIRKELIATLDRMRDGSSME